MTCKFGALTQDGSRFSSMKTVNSSTGPTIRSSMSKKAKTLKDKLLVFWVTMVEKDKNGKLFISTNPMPLPQRDLIKTLALKLIDHSTLSLNYH
jgi:hypothetical protein